MFTKNIIGIPLWRAYSKVCSVPTETPLLPLITTSALSAARTPSFTSPAKSKNPGVSIILYFISFHSIGATAAETENCLLISSGSQSVTVVPSAVFPKRSVAFALKSIASVSVVFPHFPCPVITTFLISSILYSFIVLLPSFRFSTGSLLFIFYPLSPFRKHYFARHNVSNLLCLFVYYDIKKRSFTASFFNCLYLSQLPPYRCTPVHHMILRLRGTF